MTPTQHHALHYLVELRMQARMQINLKRKLQTSIDTLKTKSDFMLAMGNSKGRASLQEEIAHLQGLVVDMRFAIIQSGEDFYRHSDGWDRDLPREMWLRALGVNESEWHTDSMRQYGQNIVGVVAVLNLENSATHDDDIALRPLNWASTMCIMRARTTNPKLGEAMHHKANELFGGAFGQWREPTLLERLGAA